MIRLDKFLADMEIGTRSQVKQYLKKGLVTVNGETEKKPERKIDENKDMVTFQGKEITYQEYVYYMFHKPADCVSATKDNQHKTVLDYFKDAPGKELFPVGRLDIDTEGLLLITNDGPLCHELLSPVKHVPKTYYAKVRGEIKEDAAELFRQGIDIGDDTLTAPAELKILKSDELSQRVKTEHKRLEVDECGEEVSHVLLTITEGRFHQVKRMIGAVGGEVVYLKRLSMGELTLDETLQPGEYRALTALELQALKK